MENATLDTGSKRVYVLWHIPSSTLLVTTGERPEVESQVQSALAKGCELNDFMLEITCEGDLIGHQYLGACIADALQWDDDPGKAGAPAYDGAPVR